jgi:hypothetical protein
MELWVEFYVLRATHLCTPLYIGNVMRHPQYIICRRRIDWNGQALCTEGGGSGHGGQDADAVTICESGLRERKEVQISIWELKQNS